ncbi:MAG TPA: hypothetical protein VGE01_01780 [Fimbriimonas sp.]
MKEIPAVWLWVSGLFFFVNLLFNIGLLIALWKLYTILNDTRPKIASLAAKTDMLIHKVQQVAERVEEVATTVRDRTNEVGGRARGVIGSAELVVHSASKQFERFSPFVVGAVTAMRLIKALNEMRHGRSAKDATKKGLLERLPARKRKKKSLLDFVTGR